MAVAYGWEEHYNAPGVEVTDIYCEWCGAVHPLKPVKDYFLCERCISGDPHQAFYVGLAIRRKERPWQVRRGVNGLVADALRQSAERL